MMFGFSLGNQDAAAAGNKGRRDLYDLLHWLDYPLKMNKTKAK
jgi:hypothetical protein